MDKNRLKWIKNWLKTWIKKVLKTWIKDGLALESPEPPGDTWAQLGQNFTFSPLYFGTKIHTFFGITRSSLHCVLG